METTANAKVSSRYARAIFDQYADGTKGAAKVKKIGEELLHFAKMIESNDDLKLALLTDLFTEEARTAIVDDLAGKLKLTAETKRILEIVSESKRVRLLSSIAERLHHLLMESADVVAMHVQSAAELGEDARKKVESRFKKVFGKDVEASYEVQPSLMGGLRVTAIGRTYDGSLAGWFEAMEEKLVGGRI
jgi:F-type H+-transporting ATPase subunit delta